MSLSSPAPILIKIGGALVSDPSALDALWRAVGRLRAAAPVVLVHGGGPQATEAARRLGHEPRIVHGRRVTTDVDLEIVQWTMRGALNTQLVARAHRHGLTAAGLSGVDGPTLFVHKRPPWDVDGETIDFGWVGDVARVDTVLLEALLAAGVVPVVAPLGLDARGHVYNVNADTVARTLAVTLSAAQFLLVTESGGVRRDATAPDSRLARCNRATFEQGVREGWIAGGMRVKLQIALEALAAGIPQVCILAPDDIVARSRGTQVVD